MKLNVRRALVALVPVVLAAVGGCGPPGQVRPPRPVAEIDQMELHVMPAPVNLDEVPGPDGLRVQVFLYRLSDPQPAAVSGTLEMILYDGNLSAASLDKHEPLGTWRFEEAQLRRLLIRKLGLWGYGMELRWGRNAPTTGAVTILGRYTSPAGKTIVSTPSAIPLAAQ